MERLDNLSQSPQRWFPEALLHDVQGLWGTKVLPRFPDRLVTQSQPLSATWIAFGPAIEYWHRAGLNAWGICEGSWSHTELANSEEYVAKAGAQLAAAGFPADTRMFDELRAAESQLGPEEEIWEDVKEEQSEFFTFSIRTGGGTRRDGFEILRDIITRHRRAWTEANLAGYLQSRWKTELQDAGQEYHRHLAAKNKAPTIKQFARIAAVAANNWFGGDLSAVYGVLALKSPVTSPVYEPVAVLGGRGSVIQHLQAELEQLAPPPAGASAGEREAHKIWVWQLATRMRKWIELREALGHAPDLRQFGTREFTNYSSALGEDPEAAWQLYSSAIERALASSSVPAVAGADEDGDHADRASPQGLARAVVARRAADNNSARQRRLAATPPAATQPAASEPPESPATAPRKGLLQRLLGR
jgi:hypothetical protein